MKQVIKLIIFAGLFTLACNEEEECSSNSATRCQEVPESGMCAAFFQNWFYDEQTNSCELIVYSGCDPRGFDSQTECETCKCKR